MIASIRREQARAAQTRAAVLAAATDLLLAEGMGAVTHRRVATEAGVSLSAIRYHYTNLEMLFLACIDEIERLRAAEADRVLDDLTDASTLDTTEQARALFRIYYGPRIDDAALVGTVGWIVDCARESSALARHLAELREVVDDQLGSALAQCGLTALPESMAAAVMDGIVLTSAAEQHPQIAERVIAGLRDAIDTVTRGAPPRPRSQ